MNRATAVQLWKEVRALLPVWLAGALVLVLNARNVFYLDLRLKLVAYTVAAFGLGAMSFGHEFSNGTLSVLLVQPTSRARIAARKAMVLALLLALLGLVAANTLFRLRFFGDFAPYRTELLVLPLVGALCVAPWLTVVCRSVLAGLTFALAIPAVLWIATGIVVSTVFDFSSQALAVAAVDAFRMSLLRSTWLAVCAAGAVFGWGSVLRLQVRERLSPQIHWPSWRWRRTRSETVTAGGRRHPLWCLITKELRLQQLMFAVAAFYLVSMALTAAFVSSNLAPSSMRVLTQLYALLAALVVGALAVAEERQAGLLDGQLLQPISVRLQWAVKLAVVATVSMLFAIGLPWLVSRQSGIFFRWDDSLAVLFLTVGALYISSISTGGLRALLWTVPVWLLGLGIADGLARYLFRASWWIAGPLMLQLGPIALGNLRRWNRLEDVSLWVFGGVVVLMTLKYAAQNFKTSDRNRGRIARQVVTLASVFTIGIVVHMTMSAVWVESYRANSKSQKSAPPRVPAPPPGPAPAASS